MGKKETSPFENDTLKRIREDPEFAEAYFEELSERPLSVQIAMLRRLRGISQVEMASKLHVKQAFVSKLEKDGTDHLVSQFQKVAKILHGRLAIIPEGGRVSLRE